MKSVKETYLEVMSGKNQAINDLFGLGDRESAEKETINTIKQELSLKGPNLWILIFAIFVASIGLNTNSSAVIIGAMLISPLMGPIVAIGVASAIQDLHFVRDALKNLVYSVVAALMSSTLYFFISPLAEAHSELLARTVPTIYDVFIAFFSGLAGMIAFTREKKSTNVIAGVAIATALMPPLCTAGYGLANLNFYYFFGALYLFVINSVYIAVATYIVARLLKFKKVGRYEHSLERTIQRTISIVAFIVLLPSMFIAYRLVQVEIREQNISNFIREEIQSLDLHVMDRKVYEKDGQTILHIMLLKDSKNMESIWEKKMPAYGLSGIKLEIEKAVPDQKMFNVAEVKSGLLAEIVRSNQDLIQKKDLEITTLKEQVSRYEKQRLPMDQILSELKTIQPAVIRIVVVVDYVVVSKKEAKTDLVGYIVLSHLINEKEKAQILDWLKARTQVNETHLMFVEEKKQ